MNFPGCLKIAACFACFCAVDARRVRRIVGGVPAESPQEDEPVVFVRFAGRTAKITGVRDFPHYVFRGLRYAHAPKGKDRFQVHLSSLFRSKGILPLLTEKYSVLTGLYLTYSGARGTLG